MTKKSKRQFKALAALNLDLFYPESLVPPPPATIHNRIREAAVRPVTDTVAGLETERKNLPTLAELSELFDRLNWQYFQGRLPRVTIEYSNRMTSAGSYTPHRKLIRIGRKYHEIFPQDVVDTLKHEMIHIIHLNHDADFKREAKRIGASLRARTHPALRRPPKYLYICPDCDREYPRQKRLRMASCGRCSSGGRFDERYKLRLLKSAKSG
jgi:predicted SprT family Zn-dependent metalloprotease